MRLLLAGMMAAMLAVVTTVDRVACFDGCTDEAQHEGPSTTTPSVCGLCQGWNGPLVITIGAPVPLPVPPLTSVASRELSAHSAPLEHPPKPV